MFCRKHSIPETQSYLDVSHFYIHSEPVQPNAEEPRAPLIMVFHQVCLPKERHPQVDRQEVTQNGSHPGLERRPAPPANTALHWVLQFARKNL